MTLVTLLGILSLNISVISLHYIPAYSVLSFAITVLISLYNFKYWNKIVENHYNRTIFILGCLFALGIAISSQANGALQNNIYYGFVYAFKVLTLVCFFILVNINNKLDQVAKGMYYAMVLYCTINDVLMLSSVGITSSGDNYFLGNKFDVVYSHLLLITLYLYNNNQKGGLTLNIIGIKKVRITAFPLFLIFTGIISAYVGSATGIAAVIIFAAFYYFRAALNPILRNRFVFLVSTAFFDSILIISGSIVNNPVITSFITNVLHRDIGMTGRFYIYERIIPLVNRSPIWGFGWGNSYYIFHKMMGNLPNAQNGILQCVINYGIITTVIMMLLYINILNKRSQNNVYYFLCLIYIYVILSSVEITFDTNMLLVFCLLIGSNISNVGDRLSTKGLQR